MAPEDLEALAETGRVAEAEPQWRGYTDFCSLRVRGLRSQLPRALDAFLADAAAWPLAGGVAFAK